MLDGACFRAPPRHPGRAFNRCGGSCTSGWGAAPRGEVPAALLARRRRTLQGKCTRKSNARDQRGGERQWQNDENLASRPPLQRLVRPRLAYELVHNVAMLREL